MTRLVALELAGDLAAWRRAGFAFDDGGRCRVGTIDVTITPGQPAFTGWAFDDLHSPVDGLPVCPTPDSSPEVAHPGGITQIDHVVVLTDDLDRTIAAFEAVGLPCKRIREATVGGRAIRQAFFRAGEAIVEVVTQPEVPPGASLWGLAVVVEDVARTAELLGPDIVGPPRAAVQPGWQIASARGAAGLGVPLAYMSR